MNVFDPWKSRRRFYTDIGRQVGRPELAGACGYVYPGGVWIERTGKSWRTVVGGRERRNPDLLKLEWALFGSLPKVDV